MSDNPLIRRLMRGNDKKRSWGHKRSDKQEKELGKRLGGFQTGHSGQSRINKPGKLDRPHKGDVNITGVARIEAKTTSAASFSVTRQMLDKIENAAVGIDVVPAIVVEFLDAQGLPDREVAIIPMHALERLINNARSTDY